MKKKLARRRFLVLTLAVGTTSAIDAMALSNARTSADADLAALESSTSGRLGVCAVDTSSGATIAYRADERFPLCSTFKPILCGAILARSASEPGLLQTRVRLKREEVVAYSPITSRHLDDGMTIEELCEAAMQYSDNTAANALLRAVGGPNAVTAFARSIGDQAFRLDRWETELNTAVVGDPRDTTTPAGMTDSLRRLIAGQVLAPSPRARMLGWMLGNTTGARRIRAGVPDRWRVGDKTGTGDHGTANDIGVMWPPDRAPIFLSVYFTMGVADAKVDEAVLAHAARIVAGALVRR